MGDEPDKHGEYRDSLQWSNPTGWDLLGLIPWVFLVLVVVFVNTKHEWFDKISPDNKALFWVGALSAFAAVVLAIVSIVGTRYAYMAAMAAIDTLRLETEPKLIAEVFPNSGMHIGIIVRNVEGELQASYTSELQGNNPAIRVVNIGRSPATNVTVAFLFEDTTAKVDAKFEESIPSLGPNEFMYGLQNLTAKKLRVSVRVMSSVMSQGKGKEVELLTRSFELEA